MKDRNYYVGHTPIKDYLTGQAKHNYQNLNDPKIRFRMFVEYQAYNKLNNFGHWILLIARPVGYKLIHLMFAHFKS